MQGAKSIDIVIRPVTIDDYDAIYELWSSTEDALHRESISKVFGLVFKNNDAANAFWEQQGYTLRTNINYRNKSLNQEVPQGE